MLRAGFNGGIRNQLPCTERRRNYPTMAVITGVFCMFHNLACSFNEVSFTNQLFALLPSCMSLWFGPESRLIHMFSSMLRRCFFPQQQQQQQQLSLRRTWHQGTFELLFILPNLATVSSCKRVHHCQMSPWPFGELFLWDSKKEKKKSRNGILYPQGMLRQKNSEAKTGTKR